ncbi:MAG TPA: Ig-like domain-containing protein [Acidimicrobiales bacterium]|nr:Ig-like domain-containing protein [Acidimicrobiales bacterium]
MFTLRRPAVYVPLLLGLVALVVAMTMFVSRGSGGSRLSAGSGNCPPVARNDAAFTHPGQPVTVDVLANDSDVDGDHLQFEVMSVSSGEADVDFGGGHPVLDYTPAPTAVSGTDAVIKYRDRDPAGDVSVATVTVAVTTGNALPLGLESARLTDRNGDIIEPRCEKLAKSAATTATTATTVATGADATAAELSASGTTPTTLKGTHPSTTVANGNPTNSGGRTVVGDGNDSGPTPTSAPVSHPTTTAPPGSNPCQTGDKAGCQDYVGRYGTTTTTPR